MSWLARHNRLLTQIEWRALGRRRVGEHNRQSDNTGLIVAILDRDLDFAAASEWDRGAKALMCFHVKRNEIVDLNIQGQRIAICMMGSLPRPRIGWLEVPVSSVETDRHPFCTAFFKRRNGCRHRGNNLLPRRIRPKDDAFIA